MYESGKNLGDVCKDVSSSVEKGEDVLPKEQQHHRDSKPRPVEVEFHLSDTVGLGIENYIIKGLRQSFPQEEIQFKVTIYDNWLAFPFINVTMDFDNLDKPLDIYFSYCELLDIVNPYDYVVLVCIQKFEEALKGVTK